MFIHTPGLKEKKKTANGKSHAKPADFSKAEEKAPKFASYATTDQKETEQHSEDKKGLSLGKITLLVLIAGFVGMLYLSHVQRTKDYFKEYRQLELEYENAKYRHEELKRDYELMTSPAKIYDKALEQGYQHSTINDPVIEVED